MKTTVRGPQARRETGRLPENHLPIMALRLVWEAGGGVRSLPEGTRDTVMATVEALLLCADEPLNARKLALFAGLKNGTEARRVLRMLQRYYDRDGTAFKVEEVAGGFQLLTRPEFHPWLVRFRRSEHDLRLSSASRETLAIIAYRQPIMRADIEAIRGVQSGEILRRLMEKGLVRIAGRHPSLGRPVQYGTTRKFLQMYGLKSLRDLPQVEQLQPPGTSPLPPS